jgi:hypothetical protein
MSPKCVASVRPVSRDRYIVTPAAGYEIIVIGDEAVVTHEDARETTRLYIEPPVDKQQRAIVRLEDGAIEVIYHAGV